MNSPNSTIKPGSSDWLAIKASGPKWKYQDARGVWHIGYMGNYYSGQGSDHTAFMYDGETGELTCVSGSRLKSMDRV